MYADFFGLKHLPFNNTPDPRFFFSTPDHEEALASLIYAVQELKGCVLLTGEVGAGKTLVSRMMMRQFGDQVSFANITHSIRSAVDLMESVCAEFNLPISEGAGNATLVRILQDYLLAEFANNHPVVLVLDEAQNLSIDAFEQLRMIGNLESDDAKLLQIVILGQPELQRTIRSAQLRQLHQRIFRSFHLTALSRPVTADYIRHRLAVAGAASPDVFDEEAINRVHAFSQGLPRLINTACDNAMLSAYSSDRKRIDGTFMAAVVDQLTAEAHPAPDARGLHLGGKDHRLEAGATTDSSPLSKVELCSTDKGRQSYDPTAESAVPRGGGQSYDRVVRSLAARLDALEQRFSEPDRSPAPTQAMIDELNAAIERARSTLRDQQSAAQSADASRGQAMRLANVVKTVLEQTRTMVARMNEATAKADRAEREARRTYQRLLNQGERTGRLQAIVRQVFDRVEHQMQALASNAVVGGGSQGSQARGQVVLSRTLQRGPEPEHFSRLLDDSREALTSLRSLVEETDEAFLDTSGARMDEDITGGNATVPSGLAGQVNNLLLLVESSDSELPQAV